MTDPNVQTVEAGPSFWRRLPLALCWALAVWPLALWLTARADPEFAVRMTQVAKTGALWGGVVLAAAVAIALVAWPPARAWLRLFADRLRRSYASDRGPLIKALGELEHFESSARHLEVGRMALARSELPLAAQHLGRAVELEPDSAAALYQLGLLTFRIGRIDTARVAFEKAEALDPGHAFGKALLEAGRAAAMLGDAAGAVRLLEQHQRVHGGGRKSHYWLGKARAAAGDRDGAGAAMAIAAEPVTQRLTAEENWFRALAQVWLWRGGRS